MSLRRLDLNVGHVGRLGPPGAGVVRVAHLGLPLWYAPRRCPCARLRANVVASTSARALLRAATPFVALPMCCGLHLVGEARTPRGRAGFACPWRRKVRRAWRSTAISAGAGSGIRGASTGRGRPSRCALLQFFGSVLLFVSDLRASLISSRVSWAPASLFILSRCRGVAGAGERIRLFACARLGRTSSRRSPLSHRSELRCRSLRSRCAVGSTSSAKRARRVAEPESRVLGVERSVECGDRLRSPLEPAAASAERRPEEGNRRGARSSGSSARSSSLSLMSRSRASLTPHDPPSDEIGRDLRLRRPRCVGQTRVTVAVCAPPDLPLGRPSHRRPPGDGGLAEKVLGVDVLLHRAAR
jgi:hypothetical protein